MKKVIALLGFIARGLGRFTVLLAALAMGVFVTIWSFEYSPPRVTLCELDRNPEIYRDRMVTVEVFVESAAGLIASDLTCSPNPVGASILRADGYESPADVQKFYEDNGPEMLSARMHVTGRYDPEATLACFGPPAAIRATDIRIYKSGE